MLNAEQPTRENEEVNYDGEEFDEEVQRYEADSYKLKYGDRWKKLASSVRDVVQPDGTIIREYVIEDPGLLDELSENEDDATHKQFIQESLHVERTAVSKSYDLQIMSNTYSKNYYSTSVNEGLQDMAAARNQLEKSKTKTECTAEKVKEQNLFFNKTKSKSSYNLTENCAERCFKPISSNNLSKLGQVNDKVYNDLNSNNKTNNGSQMDLKDEEEFDKELQSIHEQGEQFFLNEFINWNYFQLESRYFT